MTSCLLPVDGKLSPGLRLALVTLASVGLLLLATARTLEPDSRGYGTHEQLGLTPCYFQLRTGQICPACGTTTAWAHATRGQLRQAVATNLGGTLLAATAVFVAPWLLAVAAMGRWLLLRPTFGLLLTVATSLLAVMLLDWLRRLYLG